LEEIFLTTKKIREIDNIIDFNAVRSKYWKSQEDLDLKRRKEAEFLVASDIPYSAIFGFGVYNQASKEKLIQFGIVEDQIKVKEGFYF
jgi:hypothetical protein